MEQSKSTQLILEGLQKPAYVIPPSMIEHPQSYVELLPIELPGLKEGDESCFLRIKPIVAKTFGKCWYVRYISKANHSQDKMLPVKFTYKTIHQYTGASLEETARRALISLKDKGIIKDYVEC